MYNYREERYKTKKKNLMRIISTADYLYISGTLKYSFKYNDELYSGLGNQDYHTFLYKFIDDLSLKTTRLKIPLKYKILEFDHGIASEIRLIIRCPKGSDYMNFPKKAFDLWNQNPSIEITGFWEVHRSEEMDLSFFNPEWKGRIH